MTSPLSAVHVPGTVTSSTFYFGFCGAKQSGICDDKIHKRIVQISQFMPDIAGSGGELFMGDENKEDCHVTNHRSHAIHNYIPNMHRLI
jgi:hypothetical protein